MFGIRERRRRARGLPWNDATRGIMLKPTFKTLKIDDTRALQALVIEHVESLETGLKIVDERARCSAVAQSICRRRRRGPSRPHRRRLRRGRHELLRMLEAFAWCLDYPEIVGACTPSTPTLAVPLGGVREPAPVRRIPAPAEASQDAVHRLLEFRYLRSTAPPACTSTRPAPPAGPGVPAGHADPAAEGARRSP
jgi:hypothetical protein